MCSPVSVIYLKPIKGYQSGEMVIGNLKTYGLVVLRRVGVLDQVQTIIEGIGNSGK